MQGEQLLNMPTALPARRRTLVEQLARDVKALWLRLHRSAVRPLGGSLPYL